MLTAVARAFRTPDLRRKLLFTLMIMAIFRLGSAVPTPGVSYTLVAQCLTGASTQNGFVGLANLFFLPIAGKLRSCVREAAQYREMVIEGIIAIADGENPRAIEMKLNGYLG